jgi:exopolysaccharide biosynthesis polyprenyl glycosylphosphotransferase
VGGFGRYKRGYVLLSLHERGGVRDPKGRGLRPRVAVVRPLAQSRHGGYRGALDATALRHAQAPRPSDRPSTVRRRLIAVDVISLTIGYWLGALIVGEATPVAAWSTGIGLVAVGVVASAVCFSVVGLYRLPVSGIRSGGLGRLVQAMSMVALVIIIWQSSVHDVAPELVFGSVAGALVVTTIARYGFDVWLIGRRTLGDFRTAVVVAGSAAEVATLVDFLELNPEAGFRATAIVGGRPTRGHGIIDYVPWVGGLEHADEAVVRTGASGVLLAVNELPSETVNQLVVSLSSAGVPVYVSSGLAGISGARLQTISVAREPISLVRPVRRSPIQEVVKRILDVVLASALLALTAPVMAVAAVLIKAHDGGPVFFRQVRIGRDGGPFTVVKLRTMEVDAEARLAELRHRNERHGPLFKVSGDPRITPIGGFLRSAAIDELPQLFNVLTGHMSIVGPRPALPAETAEFDDELQRRHLVKPGVTGLWQVDANHKASFEEYRRLDLFYVDNWSVAMDLAVMIDTVPVIVRRALRALRRPAPSAPAPVGSAAPVPKPIEVGP